jgi:hypothetical protein
MAVYTVNANRRVEVEANQKSEDVWSDADMKWTVVHIRDDVGAVHNLIVIANALLAAILGSLLF